MSIRVRNSNRQVMRVSEHTATITRGRSNAILIGNKIISVQSNGNEHRAFYADSTLRQLADNIYATLRAKGYRKPRKKETKPRAPYKRKVEATQVQALDWKIVTV